jgi:hypothetical protein
MSPSVIFCSRMCTPLLKLGGEGIGKPLGIAVRSGGSRAGLAGPRRRVFLAVCHQSALGCLPSKQGVQKWRQVL